MILLDTSGLLAALFPDQRRHEECVQVLRAEPGPFVLSPFVLAELDYLITRHAGVASEVAFLDEVTRGAYELAGFEASDVALARKVVHRHRALSIGLADASLVVLSSRLRTLNVLTLDERHFRTLRGHRDAPFRLLPSDG